MIEFEKNLYKNIDYKYPTKDFQPFLHGYIHEDMEKRPTVIIVPGGSYAFVSPTEGENVALHFYKMGYQAFVLTYTTNVLQSKTLEWQPLEDLARALYHIKINSEAYKVLSNQVALVGFSAGGHLAMSLAVHYTRKELGERLKISSAEQKMIRPDAVVLSYPVISAGEYVHQESFRLLLGDSASQGMKDIMSLEKWIEASTPPIFLWHTLVDLAVPVENSMLVAKMCKEKSVACELHIFPEGGHGMSIPNDEWANGDLGNGSYTWEQMYDCYRLCIERGEQLPESLEGVAAKNKEEFFESMKFKRREASISTKPDYEVAKWPYLADTFLKRMWK